MSLWTSSSVAQEIYVPNKAVNKANYKMDIRLDIDEKKIFGTTILMWKNTSKDTIRDLYFHLYYNAFRNAQSTFFREGGLPEFLTSDIDEVCGWGWSHILKINDAEGNDLTAEMSYVQPDDNNADDKTVLRVLLPKALLPTEESYITFEWQAKIPKTMPRTGYNMDYYFLAQWFPKLGVYEEAGTRYATEGSWNCHQYHSLGEYYSDFGSYDVLLTVPDKYKVAATGQLIGQEKNILKDDNDVAIGATMTWHYIAESVIDFTWSASPHYIISEDNYKDTELKLYSYPGKAHFAERYFPTLKYCMAYLEDKLGPYPYPSLTIIDPPIHGLFTGGMEYPTLISSLSFNSLPAGIKTPEILVVHEFIHQYFMQMVATHEVEEPWMDEGLTSYYEGRILDSYFDAKTSTLDFWGVRAGNKEWNRAEYFGGDNPQIASNARKSWHYKHGGYGPISYNKTALWLETMEGLLGIDVMDEILKTYYQRWQYKHPARQDFINIANEVTIQNLPQQFPKGLDWYFEQVLYGTGLCDYAVASIDNKEIQTRRGYYLDMNDCNPEITRQEKSKYKSTVILHRLGEIQIPTTVKVILDDGKIQVFNWDGIDRSSEVVIESDFKIVAAHIDPSNKITLDKDILNNTLTLHKQTAGIRTLSAKFIAIFQNILETLSCLV